MLAKLKKFPFLNVTGCLVPILALLATYHAHRLTLQTVTNEEKERFNWKSELIRTAIQERADLISTHLKSVGSHYAATGQRSLATFVNDLALMEQFPDLLAIGFLNAQDRKVTDLMQRRPQEMRIRSALESNKDVLATTAAANSRSRVFVTPRLTLSTAKNNARPYFIMMSPVPSGWVVAALDPKVMTQSAIETDGLKAIIAETDVELYEGDEAISKYRLFDLHRDTTGVGASLEDNLFARMVQLRLGQYVWGVFIGVRPAFLPNQARYEPRAVALGGITASVLLAVLSATLLTTRNRAIRIAERVSAGLYDSELRFRTLCQISPGGVFEADHKGKLRYANNKWLEMNRMTPAMAVGDGWQHAIAESDKTDTLQSWLLSVETKTSCERKFRLRHSEAQDRWVLLQSLPMIGKNGEVLGFVCSWEDTDAPITNKKKAVGA